MGLLTEKRCRYYEVTNCKGQKRSILGYFGSILCEKEADEPFESCVSGFYSMTPLEKGDKIRRHNDFFTVESESDYSPVSCVCGSRVSGAKLVGCFQDLTIYTKEHKPGCCVTDHDAIYLTDSGIVIHHSSEEMQIQGRQNFELVKRFYISEGATRLIRAGQLICGEFPHCGTECYKIRSVENLGWTGKAPYVVAHRVSWTPDGNECACYAS